MRRGEFILFGLEKHRFLPRKRAGTPTKADVLPEFNRRGVANTCPTEAIRELWAHARGKIQLEVIEGRESGSLRFGSLSDFRKSRMALCCLRSAS